MKIFDSVYLVRKLENSRRTHTYVTRHIDLAEIAIGRVGFVNSMDLCVCVREERGYVEVTVPQDCPFCLALQVSFMFYPALQVSFVF